MTRHYSGGLNWNVYLTLHQFVFVHTPGFCDHMFARLILRNLNKIVKNQAGTDKPSNGLLIIKARTYWSHSNFEESEIHSFFHSFHIDINSRNTIWSSLWSFTMTVTLIILQVVSTVSLLTKAQFKRSSSLELYMIST